MIVYRIAKEKYIKDLSGEGARLFGGRWNKKGTSILYTAENRSLAAIEYLVHVPANLLPDDLYITGIIIPENCKGYMIDLKKELPHNWQHYPAPSILGDIIEDIFEKKNPLYIKVPSVLVKWEWNILINPNHLQMNNVSITSIDKFNFDKRLNRS